MKSLLTDQIVANDIPARTLLGLEPRDEDVGDLRQLQLAPLRGKGRLRLWMGIGMALLAAFTMVHSMAWPIISGWLAGAMGFSLWSYRVFATLPLGDPKSPGTAEFRLCSRHALLSAAVWALPFWLHGPIPPLDHALSIWAIALLMMLTLAIAAHSLPRACILFIAPVSLSASAALFAAGSSTLAGVAVVAGILLSLFCIRFAQAHVRFRRAEETLHEKSETVSLLLREFEETSADWLWQTDNSRRLIHISPRLAYALGGTAEALEGVPLLQALSGDAWETGNFPKTLRRNPVALFDGEGMIGRFKENQWRLSDDLRMHHTFKVHGFRISRKPGRKPTEIWGLVLSTGDLPKI